MSTNRPTRALSATLLTGLYQALLVLFGAGYLLLRLARRKPVTGLAQRLAWYPKGVFTQDRARRPVWLHVVSVGEALGAKAVIEEIQRRFPEMPWVISTTTPTGQAVARRLIRPGRDRLIYLPWDLGPVVRRAVRAIQPSLFISFETELWPVLFRRLSDSGVPVMVVNGRISPGAHRRYLLVRPFMRRALERVTLLLVQSAQDARRYAAIGAPKDRIVVTGNVKWDVSPGAKSEGARDRLRGLLGLAPRAVLWTAGSTHPGEEALVLQSYRRLKPAFPQLRLLIAPRHPERADAVAREIEQAGFGTVRRSRISTQNGAAHGEDPVFLLDTLGELGAFYEASDLVFVGGSLVPRGGHNLIEPAAFSRAIVTGPHLHNFQAVAEALAAAGGVVIAKTPEELEAHVQRLLQSPLARKELGHRAYGVIREHRGATSRTADLVLRKWDPAAAGRAEAAAEPDLPFQFPGAGVVLGAAELAYRAGLSAVGAGYRTGLLKKHRLPAPVVSVGNLTWGGTGKTPLVMLLAQRLSKAGFSPAVLTRGYGGDEARLMAERLAPIPVIVDPDRVAAGKRAVAGGADLLLLDDGFQQWRLHKDFELLTIDASNPFGNRRLIPRGILREQLPAAARAHAVVVTKCDMNPGGLERIEEEVRRWNPEAPLFFARYRPSALGSWPHGKGHPVKWLKGKRICTLAGVGSPGSFESLVRAQGAEIALRYRVRDHHPYTAGELLRMMARCREHGIDQIVTTAKDAVRLPGFLPEATGPGMKGFSFLVLDVELEMEPDEGELLHRIRTVLAR